LSDVASKVVSIINLTSVAAVEDLVDAPVNRLRFRGNVYVTGWSALSELDLLGKELNIGPHARLKVETLMRALGHGDCGIYTEVTARG